MILAGGKSRRMGQDKLPLELGGVPLIMRVLRALESSCEELLIVGGDGPSPPMPARHVPDLRRTNTGPLAGIEAGLRAARRPSVFVAAGDVPFLSERLVKFLLGLLAEYGVPAVVPYQGGRLHPLCAAYGRDAVLPAVKTALDSGVRAVREVVGGLPGVMYVEERELRAFGDPARLLMNVNSPEDLARARAMLLDES